jgi:hypothetical protein
MSLTPEDEALIERVERYAKNDHFPDLADEFALIALVRRLSRELTEAREALALWKQMRFTPPDVDNSTATWCGAYMDAERALDAAAGITHEDVRRARRALSPSPKDGT